MASIESLPADQRAVLELVLRRGRSYDEIAQLLSIDRAEVRQRALAALDALGPTTRVPPERRALITDYLLGALPETVAEEVRSHLSQSAGERAWARALSGELQGLAEHPLPEVPADAGGRARPQEPATAATPASATPDSPAGAGPRTSSRRGGALLLAGSAAVVAVVLVLLFTGGDKKHAPARPSRSAVAGTTGITGATGTTGARVVSAIALKPPSGGKAPLGFAEVLQVQGRLGVAIAAQGLTANTKHPPNAYAVWLYNSPADSKILGFVNPAVGSNGQLKTAGGLPSNASHFQNLLVTLETKSNPRSPGTIVLEGHLKL